MTHLNVQLKSVPQTVRLKADKVEENADTLELVAKDAKGNLIGKFIMENVAGWWTDDE